MKITQILANAHQHQFDASSDKIDAHFSFEYFLPRKLQDHDACVALVSDMVKKHQPLYLDLTWRGDIGALEAHLSLGKRLLSLGLEVMLHIACAQLNKADTLKVLNEVREAGIQNIMALRGDPADRSGPFKPFEDGFSCARDFVKFIRETHGDYFCVAVSGYPEGHATSNFNMDEEIKYTVEKVQAGADMVVTQGCFDANTYTSYINRCREMGADVPVIPGILMFKTKAAFFNMARICEISIPQSWADAINAAEDPVATGRKLVLDLTVELIHQHGLRGVHLYTMNDDKPVTQLMEGLEAHFASCSRVGELLTSEGESKAELEHGGKETKIILEENKEVDGAAVSSTITVISVKESVMSNQADQPSPSAASVSSIDSNAQ